MSPCKIVVLERAVYCLHVPTYLAREGLVEVREGVDGRSEGVRGLDTDHLQKLPTRVKSGRITPEKLTFSA